MTTTETAPRLAVGVYPVGDDTRRERHDRFGRLAGGGLDRKDGDLLRLAVIEDTESACVSPAAGPFLSRTITSISTSLVLLRKDGVGLAAAGAPLPVGAGWAAAAHRDNKE